MNAIKKLIFVFSVCYLIILPLHAAGNPHYAILMDAGSTGTRAHLFEYSHDTTVPTITDLYSVSTKPGLSSYKNMPQDSYKAIEPLLKEMHTYLSNKNIPEAEVSVTILATAGMRLLPQPEQEAIYRHVESFLKTNYAYPIRRIQTIAGDDEALYAWLDVNYLNNTFHAKSASVGTLDMGGASTQIAFELSNASTVKIPAESISHIKIGNQAYTVFRSSYLGLGQDQLRAKVNESNGAFSCYPMNYPLPNTTGAFNFGDCQQQYQTTLSAYQPIFSSIPHFSGEMIAFSGFYYQFNFFKEDPHTTREKFQQKVKEVCGNTWEKLQQQYPSQPADYLATYCANAAYHDILLHQSYKLADQQLTITKKINGKEIDWTLGALLYLLASDNAKAINNR